MQNAMGLLCDAKSLALEAIERMVVLTHGDSNDMRHGYVEHDLPTE